jgi:hypothetical protein
VTSLPPSPLLRLSWLGKCEPVRPSDLRQHVSDGVLHPGALSLARAHCYKFRYWMCTVMRKVRLGERTVWLNGDSDRLLYWMSWTMRSAGEP